MKICQDGTRMSVKFSRITRRNVCLDGRRVGRVCERKSKGGGGEGV